jgi:hypothetical protein
MRRDTDSVAGLNHRFFASSLHFYIIQAADLASVRGGQCSSRDLRVFDELQADQS